MLKKIISIVFIVCSLGEIGALIAREALFGSDCRHSLKMSVNGKTVSYISDKSSKISIMDLDSKKIKEFYVGNIGNYFWSNDNRHILFEACCNGNERYRLFVLDTLTGKKVELVLGVSASQSVRLLKASTIGIPKAIVIVGDEITGLNDVYSINLISKKKTKLQFGHNVSLVEEQDRWSGIFIDQYADIKSVRYVSKSGGYTYLILDRNGNWIPLLNIGQNEALGTKVVFVSQNRDVYLLTYNNRNNVALYKRICEKDKRTEIVVYDSKFDITDALICQNRILAYKIEKEKGVQWIGLDPATKKHFQKIERKIGISFDIIDISANGKKYIIKRSSPGKVPEYYLYDNEKIHFLFFENISLKRYKLSKATVSFRVETRDNKQLICIMSTPNKLSKNNKYPLILFVHGGPWLRESYTFDPIAEWLNDRGYVVLKINYRGSFGFGKKFLISSWKEWGRKMNDDLEDAVYHVCQNFCYIDSKKIAIMGGSYGGFAVLVAVSRRNHPFSCGVDMFGQTDVISFLKNMPAVWQRDKEIWNVRVGDINNKNDLSRLNSISPTNNYQNIKVPLLIIHGAQDKRIPNKESDNLVSKMKKNKQDVLYVSCPDCGHGFWDSKYKFSILYTIEVFLKKNLGGEIEQFNMSKNI